MKLKLTFERGGGRPSADLLVTAEPSTTVGELAAHLAASDPEASSAAGGAGSDLTLALGIGHAEVPPEMRLSDSPIASGAAVALARPGTSAVSSAAAPVAVLAVTAGPDAGREFNLPAGTSFVGRDRTCEVRLSDPMVSRRHARVHVGETVELVDAGSANGLVVGSDTVDRVVVRTGDEVGIGDDVVVVRRLRPARGPSPTGTVSFNRPPRIDTRFPGVELAAPEPPEQPSPQRFPILPLFAPLILGLVIYLATRSVVSLVFVGMSPLLIVANAVEGRVSAKRTYGSAVEQFRRDITDLVAEAGARSEEEVHARLREAPSVDECLEAAKSLSPLLWSRWPDLPGFLSVRLGLGSRPSRSHIEVASGRRNNRDLWHELEQAIEPFSSVEGVPVLVELAEAGALGIGGPRAEALGAARSILVQATVLHSPADLVLVAMASRETARDWEWLKWLPHCDAPTSPLSGMPLASSDATCAALLDELEALIAERESSGHDGEGASVLPAVLVVIDDDAPMVRSRASSVAQRGGGVGVHVLWVSADVAALPAACRTFLEVGGSGHHGAAGFVHTGERVEPLALGWAGHDVALSTARCLAPVVDASAPDANLADLPQSVSFLSLSGRNLATMPEAVIERWVESRSVLVGPWAAAGSQDHLRPGTLRATLGESASGPHVLDLRAHGPHALVGGTTGSGKSELLQSWILGMAVTNSPQRVTFLLVDYKGGSAFSECRHLPHTVGLVTDLSPHLVRRALTSLSAELRKREELLHRKRAKDLVSLERTGDPEAPPSLVIVVDEFAALVQDVPEFVDGVVNVAQRGRSLGLHLILATQRPAGVIKENLRANTNLRIALRVNDVADSVDVLGSPEAAGFDAAIPGRAVSRTGPSQLVPFQSAYVGGWTSDERPLPEIEVATFGFGLRAAWEVPKPAAVPERRLGPTDIERLVANVTAANQLAELPSPRPPWLPALAAQYDLAKLPTRRRDDELIFAVADEPQLQEQPTVAFRPDEDGNLAVFGTGNSGKSTVLRSLAIAAGFTVRGGPCEVYGMDFGSRGLQMLESLPHVGSVVAGSDVERVGRLLNRLREIIDERATRYAKVGAGTITDYRRIGAAPQEARVLLLVDGMGAFRNAYEATEHLRLFETFLGIAADGRPVGVHVVVSADRAGALPIALSSHVQRRIVLRLADANDYTAFGLPADVLDTSSPPGRGLLGATEIQVAVLGGSADLGDQAREVTKLARSMREAGIAQAVPVERLTDWVAIEDLPPSSEGDPVFAVAGDTLAPVPFSPSGTFTVAGGPGSGRTTALATVVAAMLRHRPDVRCFYFGNPRSALLPAITWERSATDAEEAALVAAEVTKSMAEEDDAPASTVVIEAINDFLNSPADLPLQDLIRACVRGGHFVVSDGEPSGLSGSYPLLVAARSSRTGIVLQPEQADGMLFRSQFPSRLRRVDFPPGRGLYVRRGGVPVVVQVGIGGMGRTPH